MNHQPFNIETQLFETLKAISLKDYRLIPYKIKLNMPWQTSSSNLSYRQGLLVKLIINDSLSVIGECAPMTEIGTESAKKIGFIHCNTHYGPTDLEDGKLSRQPLCTGNRAIVFTGKIHWHPHTSNAQSTLQSHNKNQRHVRCSG